MKKIIFPVLCIALLMASCKKDDSTNTATSKDINTAAKASIDRFSSTAGHLMVRTSTNGLPEANAPINYDVEPFITKGLDRTGAHTQYYNFDVQPTTPDDIYVFFKADSTDPVSGQNNVVPTIPGDTGYSDFWLVNKVTVPNDYVPNSITSEAEVLASGYPITKTTTIVNCPIVPFGSTAARSSTANTASSLHLGWYKDMAVAYFTFDEAGLSATGAGLVPLSPIYVTFANNTSPADGFKTEPGTSQTHNVIATIPGDTYYSPLWNVFVEDSSHFSAISDLTSATSFTTVAAGATVNCPVVQ